MPLNNIPRIIGVLAALSAVWPDYAMGNTEPDVKLFNEHANGHDITSNNRRDASHGTAKEASSFLELLSIRSILTDTPFERFIKFDPEDSTVRMEFFKEELFGYDLERFSDKEAWSLFKEREKSREYNFPSEIKQFLKKSFGESEIVGLYVNMKDQSFILDNYELCPLKHIRIQGRVSDLPKILTQTLDYVKKNSGWFTRTKQRASFKSKFSNLPKRNPCR